MNTHTHASSIQPADEPLLIGIDIAKDQLDLARSDLADVTTFANDDHGINKLVESLAHQTPTCIVIEATGGYERTLLNALLDAGLPVARVNPGRVRHLAKALGILAKTDAVDAHVLVAFARHAHPRLATKTPEKQAELDALVTCRRQLLNTKTEQTNRRGTTHSKPARKAIDAVIKTLQKQIDSLNQQITQLIDHDDPLKRMDQRLRSVPGVGAILSATLLSSMTELGSTNRRQAAALVGVAPYNRDSGKHHGTRAIRGGRADIRSTLYMATLAAMRCNPIIKTFADRLKANGKRNKVVITACMRKLMTLLNAMIRDGLNWDELNLVKNLTPNP